MSFRSRLEFVKDNIHNFEWGASGVVIVALLSSLILPASYAMEAKIAAGVLFFICVIFFLFIRRIDYMGLPPTITHFVNVPCSLGELEQAIAIAQFYFGRHALRPDTVRICYQKNPYCVIPIKNGTGNVIGYGDIFGLSKDCFDSFIQGTKAEYTLSSDDFLTLEKIRTDRRIYIGGIAIKAAHRFESHKATAELIYTIADILINKYIQNDESWELYSLGYSEQGRNILHKLGFGIKTEGHLRVDKSPLYWRKIEKSELLRLQERWPVDREEILIRYEGQDFHPLGTVVR